MMHKVFISTMVMDGVLSNYGTFLQYYALRKIVADLGYVPHRWMRPPEHTSFVAWIWRIATDILRVPYWSIKRIPNLANHIKELFPNLLTIQLFRNEYRRLIGPFKEDNTLDDSAICLMGSDQVMMRDPHAWFADRNYVCKRIIYAASSDWTEFPSYPDWRELVARELPRFAHIALREEKGIEVCRQYLANGQAPIVQVVDPVVLAGVDFWNKVIRKDRIFTKPTLFCYLVNVYTQDELRLDVLRRIALELNCDLKVVGVQGLHGVLPRQHRLLVSPLDFVRCMRDAEFVITNSFHGSVFALLFEKQFLSVKQIVRGGTDQNRRQFELMTRIDLIERWVDMADGCEELLNRLKAPVDWIAVDGKIKKRQEFSRRWLANALSN